VQRYTITQAKRLGSYHHLAAQTSTRELMINETND
jgi:hypothetical protein